MEAIKKFTFLYPVSNLTAFPALYVTDLKVTAIAEIGREGQVLKTKMVSVMFNENDQNKSLPIQRIK